MKRTTVSLPDDLAAALAREARRRNRSASEITRDALARHLGLTAGVRRELPFAAVGRSGHRIPPFDHCRPCRGSRSCTPDASRGSGMVTLAVVDAGPLYAAADADDVDHDRSLTALSRSDLRLVIPALVVAEATYFVGRRLGAAAEATFLRGIGALDVEGPSDEDFHRMAELVEQYADFPLGGTDASVVALAERLEAPVVVTLDQRHFAAVRPSHREAFELVP
jgi:predicted nucleic acid-binding protein/predicted transcriptional regulator